MESLVCCRLLLDVRLDRSLFEIKVEKPSHNHSHLMNPSSWSIIYTIIQISPPSDLHSPVSHNIPYLEIQTFIEIITTQ